MIDGAVEHSESDLIGTQQAPVTVQNEGKAILGGANVIEDGGGLSSDAMDHAIEETKLFKAPEEGPENVLPALNLAASVSAPETGIDARNEEASGEAEAQGLRNVSDSSISKRRRWGIWGGLRQDKGET